MRKNESRRLLARIIQMEFRSLCRQYFENVEEEPDTLPQITDFQIALADEAAALLTDEQYVMLHILLERLQRLKKLTGEEKAEAVRSLIYRYMDMVYLEYYREMGVPEDYFLLLDREVLALYNKLAGRKQRVPEKNMVNDTQGRPLYRIEGTRVLAYRPDGEKLCDTTVDENGNIKGWKKTGNYTGGFEGGTKSGKGVEYYDTAGCAGIRREGIWSNDVFVEGTEYGVLVYRTEGFEIKRDFDGRVLHKDLDYIWDVIMGDGESARYYFADVKLKDGRYTIIEDTVRPAIV